MALWSQAFRAYALGAAITDQLSFADSMAHMSIVYEVANTASGEGRTRALGVIFDEVARFCLTFFVCGVLPIILQESPGGLGGKNFCFCDCRVCAQVIRPGIA